MSTVLVIGASGYIGGGIATALRNRGHEVWALVRSDNGPYTNQLRIQGIKLFIGNVTDISSWIHLADKASHIVLASNVKGDDVTGLLKERSSATGASKTVVYTSGCLVYSNDKTGATLTESSPTNPLPFVAWRVGIEQQLLDAAKPGAYIGRVVIIRPTFVYGKKGSGYLEAFKPVTENGSVVVIGSGDNVIQTVHIDDLANLYVRAVENEKASGVYNASSDYKDSYKAIVGATARAVSEEAQVSHREPNPESALDQMFQLSIWVDSSRAQNELGWVHRHKSLIEEVDVHYKSWLADKELAKKFAPQ